MILSNRYAYTHTHACLCRLVYPSNALFYQGFTRHPAFISGDLGLSPASLSPSHARSPHGITVHRYSGESDGSMPSMVQDHTSCIPHGRKLSIPDGRGDPDRGRDSCSIRRSVEYQWLWPLRTTVNWMPYPWLAVELYIVTSSVIYHVLFIKIRMTFWCLILAFLDGKGVHCGSMNRRILKYKMFDLPSY